MLVLPLVLSKYNPVSGVILTGILGVGTVILVYLIGKRLVSTRLGLIAAFLYATSVLTIVNARTAYHTSPIPFFTALLILALIAWIKGKKMTVPFMSGCCQYSITLKYPLFLYRLLVLFSYCMECVIKNCGQESSLRKY